MGCFTGERDLPEIVSFSGFFMLEYFVVILVAFGASMLTFFSGFGLGTMLTPAFALFFPIEIAVASTAVVHFLNNLFKLILVGKSAVVKVILAFGLPAILGSIGGAFVLNEISTVDFELHFELFAHHETTLLKIVLGLLILFFAILEFLPSLKNIEFNKKWFAIGGILSGFFGGLSGHQGALRSAFLIKFNLSKEQFIATGVVIACLVDIMRLGVYSTTMSLSSFENPGIIIAGTLAAFLGAFIGKKALKKVTINFVQICVGSLMSVIALLMIFGII